MALFKNPLPGLLETADAAAQIMALQADLFVIKQEMRMIRQIKRIIALAMAWIFFNLLATLSVYWLGVGLHEKGWTPWELALLTLVIFGTLTLLMLIVAGQVGKSDL